MSAIIVKFSPEMNVLREREKNDNTRILHTHQRKLALVVCEAEMKVFARHATQEIAKW